MSSSLDDEVLMSGPKLSLLSKTPWPFKSSSGVFTYFCPRAVAIIIIPRLKHASTEQQSQNSVTAHCAVGSTLQQRAPDQIEHEYYESSTGIATKMTGAGHIPASSTRHYS